MESGVFHHRAESANSIYTKYNYRLYARCNRLHRLTLTDIDKFHKMEFYGKPNVRSGDTFVAVAVVDWHSTIGRRVWMNFGNVFKGARHLYLFLKTDDRWANVYMLLDDPYNSKYPSDQWFYASYVGELIRLESHSEYTRIPNPDQYYQ